MLTAILPLLEALGAEGGSASSLGHGSGIGATLGKLLQPPVHPFGDQNELDGALKHISDLTANIAQAREAMSSMRSEHEALGNKAREDERLYGFRDPGEATQMAELQRQQIEHARTMQQQQEQMQALQARAAVTMDPQLAQQESRRGMFQRASALAAGGQAIQSVGPSFLRNLPGVTEGSESLKFIGGPGANIAGQMAGQAASSASNVAGGAMQGASIGSLAGPEGAALGAVVGGLAAASKEVSFLPKRIVDWSESLVESQRTISRFSGPLAGALAQHDVRGLKRDIASAQTTGGSTADLTKTLDKLYDAVRPLKDTFTVAIARDLSVLVGVIGQFVPLLKKLVEIGSYMADPTDGLLGIRKAGKDVRDAEERMRNGINAHSVGMQSMFKQMRGKDPLIPPAIPRRK